MRIVFLDLRFQVLLEDNSPVTLGISGFKYKGNRTFQTDSSQVTARDFASVLPSNVFEIHSNVPAGERTISSILGLEQYP